VCERRAHSFRIVRVKDLRILEGQFYHGMATCAGSMVPDIAAAMDLLRLKVEQQHWAEATLGTFRSLMLQVFGGQDDSKN
jgi:hypothetical protein